MHDLGSIIPIIDIGSCFVRQMLHQVSHSADEHGVVALSAKEFTVLLGGEDLAAQQTDC